MNELLNIFSQFVDILLAFSQSIGYLGVFLLMAVESSFVPFPSEVVVPPAAYLAAQGEMNIFFVVLAGILGSLLGAGINYFLALTLGRKAVYSLASTRLAKIFLIDEIKIQKAEKYFIKYGSLSTFLGRLLPAIRQLISIPAGFSKMDLKKFFFFTFLGSGLWTIILAVLGYMFGANEGLFMEYYKNIKEVVVVIGILVIIFFIIKNIIKKKNKEKKAP